MFWISGCMFMGGVKAYETWLHMEVCCTYLKDRQANDILVHPNKADD